MTAHSSGSGVGWEPCSPASEKLITQIAHLAKYRRGNFVKSVVQSHQKEQVIRGKQNKQTNNRNRS